MPLEEVQALPPQRVELFVGIVSFEVRAPQLVTAVYSFQLVGVAWELEPVIVSFVHSQTLPDKSQTTSPVDRNNVLRVSKPRPSLGVNGQVAVAETLAFEVPFHQLAESSEDALNAALQGAASHSICPPNKHALPEEAPAFAVNQFA